MATIKRTARRCIAPTSLVLCLATLCLWVRSYRVSDSLDQWRREVAGPGTYHDTRGVFSSRGSIGGGYLRIYLPTTQDWPNSAQWRFNSGPAQSVSWPHRWWFLGFGYWDTTFPPGPAHRGLRPVGARIPHWFVALLFGVSPAVAARGAWRQRRERKRLAAGLCTGCGYDVRASRERCPECGAALPTSSPAATV